MFAILKVAIKNNKLMLIVDCKMCRPSSMSVFKMHKQSLWKKYARGVRQSQCLFLLGSYCQVVYCPPSSMPSWDSSLGHWLFQ